MIQIPGPDMSWEQNYLYSLLPISMTIVFYSAYWLVASSGRIKRKFYSRYDHDKASLYHITLNRVTGLLLMGVLPPALCLLFLDRYTLADIGLGFRPETATFTVVSFIAVSIILVPFISRNARKPEILASYPQIRAEIWTKRTVAAELLTWALYLLGYEILFRGVLLFTLKDSLGIWIAIAINTALYSAAHIAKGMSETIAAIPFGVLLCILTLHSGSIWIAFFLHLVNALTITFAALRYNPEMRFVRSR